ncbi:CoA transferase [Desulfosarcina widdelii]|uniref:CoA transferase n=1 Tax=Desulfosarcina widdelii TaxID=947919 RepID=A0A5K7Z4I0_9BACT|nr:CaiB/BaiF CoA-transferase family protein [Desulfosarcina widdelii]BBO74501.1 CoA transferase [Desulfosarcina widdelii]
MSEKNRQKPAGPLDGLKVVDLTRMLPGPFGTMLLADLGADVIVVEQPSGPALGPRRKNFYVDRNKRSMALNLKDERARKILYRLVADADVFVEGFRPGVTERLEIDYPTLKRTNPGLIYCSISGYGQDGPDRLRVGHDLNYAATAGLLHLNGRKDTGPVIFATQVSDIAGGGMLSAFSIMAALYHRQQTGNGQHIDVSMTDGALALNPLAFLEYSNAGKAPVRQGYRNLGATPCYNIYRTKDDEYITIGALEPKFWATLCRLLDREDLIDRKEDTSGETVETLQSIFATRTRAEWDRLLDDKEVCYAPVLDMEEVCSNRQYVYRKMIHEEIDVDGTRSVQAGVVPRFSMTPGTLRRLPSRPGQHSREILSEQGLDQSTIDNLEKEGVVKSNTDA